MLLFLVGYAGSGKSSMGKRLAKRLDVRYVDTDRRVEQSEGATIADIFHYEGEEYFRRAERGVIEELREEGFSGVIATGGGLPVWSDNMARLNELGTTIYLRRGAEGILSRLSDYGREKRPLFRGKSDEELLRFMHEHMAEREPWYSMAHVVVECDTMSDDDAVNYIVATLEGSRDE